MPKLILLLSLLLPAATLGQQQQSRNPDPVLNFDVFWRSYEAKYPFFDDKGIDWKARYRTYRPRVSDTTSPATLFRILSEMVRPLHDAHVMLRTGGPGRQSFWARKPSLYSNGFQFRRDSLLRYWRATDATLEANGFGPVQTAGGPHDDSTQQFYYAKSGQYGYLRIIASAFGAGGSKLKLRELDSILAHFGPVNGLIIDIRFHRGGGDRFNFAAAGRFAERGKPGIYRYRRRKGGGYSDFVKLTTFRLRPRGRQRYTGKPIVLLTNDRTVSAGDGFALLMHVLPHVTVVGENTEGSFDAFRWNTLPNGWQYSVPQKRYHDSFNHCYEGTGVPVDVFVKDDRSALTSHTDAVLLKALDVLRKE